MLLMLLLMILTLTEVFEDLSKSGAQGKRRDAVQASTHEKLRTLTAHAAALLQSCGEEAPKWAISGTLELCGQLNEQLSSLVQKVGESMFVLDEAAAIQIALGESNQEVAQKGQLLHAARQELLSKELSLKAMQEQLMSSEGAITDTQAALQNMQRQLVVITAERDAVRALVIQKTSLIQTPMYTRN